MADDPVLGVPLHGPRQYGAFDQCTTRLQIGSRVGVVDASDVLVLEVKGSGQFGYVEFRESFLA